MSREYVIGGLKFRTSKELGVASKLQAPNSDVMADAQDRCTTCVVRTGKEKVKCHGMSSQGGLALVHLNGVTAEEFMRLAACKINEFNGLPLPRANVLSSLFPKKRS